MIKRRRLLVLTAVVAAAGLLLLSRSAPPGPRSLRAFDPDRMADLEVQMWQAYYAKQKGRLFVLLVKLTREQFHYDWDRAVRAGFHLARAAATFGDARGGYDVVLPDLERAYVIARDWTGGRFDPRAVARAELGWWVARRLPAENTPEKVGAHMADLYALLYEVPRERVQAAALLRAQAGDLRDRGEDHADWAEVSRLLHQSYLLLRAGLQP